MPSNTTNTASIIERKKTELQQHLDTIKKAVDIQHSTSKGPMSSTQKRKNSVDDDEYVDSNTKRTKVLKRNRRTSPIVTRRKSVTDIDSPPLSESDPQEEIEEEVVASDQEPEDEEPRIRRKRREPFDLENLDPEMRKCYKLLHEFLSHKNSWPFREPVDPEALGVPNYFDIIQHPMDLSTIDTKLVNNEYKTTEDFANDMRLVWNNAITFNTPGDFYYKTAQKFSQMFEKKWGIATATSKPFIPTSNRRGRKKVEPATYPNFTFQDKANLADQIRQMSVEELGKVLQIIKQSRGTILETNDELELDVDAMDNATLYRLLKFAEICTQKRGNAPTSKVVSPPTTASTTTSV